VFCYEYVTTLPWVLIVINAGSRSGYLGRPRRNKRQPKQGRGSPLSLVLAVWRRNRDLLDNASTLVATTVVTAGLGFVYWAIAARLFNEQSVGYGSAAVSAMTLLGTIGVFGLGTLLIGELPRRKDAGGLISAALITASIGSLVMGLGFAVVAPHISDHLMGIGGSPGHVALFTAGVVVTAFALVVDQATIGIMRGGIQLARNVAFGVVKLLILPASAFILHDAFGIGIECSWVAGMALSLVLIAARLRVSGTRVLPAPDWRLLRRLGKTALAHNWLNLSMAVPILLMPVIVTATVSPSAAAAYYVAWMLAFFLYSIPSNLTTVLFAIAAADPAAIAGKLRLSLRLSFVIGIIGMAALGLSAHLVLSIFGPGYVRTAFLPLMTLIIGYIFVVPRSHFVAVRRAQGRVSQAAVILTIGTAMEIIGAVVGAKLHGLAGLSVALLLARIIEGLMTAPTVVRASLVHGRHGKVISGSESGASSPSETVTHEERQEAGTAMLISPVASKAGSQALPAVVSAMVHDTVSLNGSGHRREDGDQVSQTQRTSNDRGAMTDTGLNSASGVDRQSMFTLREPIKLVIWDLDDTFWVGTLNEGGVELLEANVAVVRELNRRGIVNSICSKNDFAAVEQRLIATDRLWDQFVFPRIGWMPKGQTIAQLIDDMQLRPPNVLFIDDNISSLREAEYFAVGLQTAGPEIIPKLLDLPQAKGKDDSKLSRLRQYRQLQAKLVDRQSWTASNEEFLRSCGIHVEISADLAAERERVLELINCTNQLDYTKRRLTEDEFTDLIIDPGRHSGYIRVFDRYGDYGISGFYSIKNGELTDFLFSCRILHMGVENWLYQHLGSPTITVIGDVATVLDPETPVPWINTTAADGARTREESKAAIAIQAKVLLKGGCDLIQVDDSLAGRLDTELSYTNYHGCYVEWHHIEVMRRSNPETLSRFGAIIDRLPFISRSEYNTRVLDPACNYTHIALSLLNEYGQGLYRLRNTDFVVPYGQYYVDITDPRNWSELAANGLRPAFLEWFNEEFEFCGAVTIDRFRENIRWLSRAIPAGRTLVLINGAEVGLDDLNVATTDLHLHHRRYNQALDELTTELSNVRICDVRDFIRTSDDVTFNTRHYSRKTYLKLAESLAEQTQSSLRVVERRPLTSVMHKAIRLSRAPDLPARALRVLRSLRS